jgi:hypothetical protein
MGCKRGRQRVCRIPAIQPNRPIAHADETGVGASCPTASRIAEVILRPVVTIAIDRATRFILGIGVAQFPIEALKNCIDDTTRRDIGSDK